MSRDPKLDEAEKLIDSFAEQLLALNDGKAIPRQWKNYLLKKIRPMPSKPGQKRDYEQVAEVVKRLVLVGNKVRAQRTKHHNPAVYKDDIASELGISRKTVERIDSYRPEYMSELSQIDSLEPEERKAYINGLAAAIGESLRADDEAEEKARQQEMQRRFPKLLKPHE